MIYRPSMRRRDFIRTASEGTLVVAFGGGVYAVAPSEAYAKQKRSDGRPRVPPGQRVLTALKPMGGSPGSPSRSQFRLKVYGEVEKPFELDFKQLLAFKKKTRKSDVHCVTGWTVLDAVWTGTRVRDLAKKAKVKKTAHYVIFEAAHGYTANVPLKEALGPKVMVAHRLGGKPLRRAHGAPVRVVVPDLYFWKSAKWLTGIRFVKRDQPGYWETRGYHNHADPWKEERHS